MKIAVISEWCFVCFEKGSALSKSNPSYRSTGQIFTALEPLWFVPHIYGNRLLIPHVARQPPLGKKKDLNVYAEETKPGTSFWSISTSVQMSTL